MKKLSILAFLLAAALLLTGCGQDKTPESTAAPAAEVPAATEAPATEETAAAAEEPAAGEKAEKTAEEKAEQPFLVQITDDDPAIAYVLVRMQNFTGLLPLPAEGEYTRTIRQSQDDGTEAYNTLHLTANGFWMEDANCPGHDCINEGEVTLENRETRVLWNMVICLPHQLSAELITRQEAEQLLGK